MIITTSNHVKTMARREERNTRRCAGGGSVTVGGRLEEGESSRPLTVTSMQ
jgi:hypothetical protein